MTPQLLTLVGSGDAVASHVTTALSRTKLRVVQSFDLASARADHIDCTCPHHGSELCDCQLIVLLVYGDRGPPASITIHGRDGLTQLALVTDAAQRPIPELEAAITNVLISAFPSSQQTEVQE